jgi:hypothetical protein
VPTSVYLLCRRPGAASRYARIRLSCHSDVEVHLELSPHSDEATTLEWWIASPRLQLAQAVSDLGQRIMRLGNRIDDSASNGDESEAWSRGYARGRSLRNPSRKRI